MKLTGCQFLSIQARFLRYVKRLPSGCMIWTGGRSVGGGRDKRKRGGPYGSFYVNEEIGTRRAHVVWAWIEGKLRKPSVPDGKHLDHQCKSGTLCVCCTTLVPKSLNLAMAKKRRHPKGRDTEGFRVAEKARLARVAEKRNRAAADDCSLTG